MTASISSRSAGPGTRVNIDEFTETTSRAIEAVGGAAHGKAIIILNPAEPPMIIRNTVLALIYDPDGAQQSVIRESIMKMIGDVSAYVPGYHLKQDIQFAPIPRRIARSHPHQGHSCDSPGVGLPRRRGRRPLSPGVRRTSASMTSAASCVGEEFA